MDEQEEVRVRILKKTMKESGEISDFLSDPARLKRHQDSWEEARKDFTVYVRDENGKYIKKKK
jgi:hypothetical protein